MSIAKSQLDAIAKGSLNEADYSIDDIAKIDLNNPTLALFSQYATLFLESIEKQIKEKNLNASGKLSDTTSVKANEDGSGIKILMAYYYDYVNKGVKGVDDF